MAQVIRAVVFDLGGTLEYVYHDDASLKRAVGGLSEMLRGAGLTPGLSLNDLETAVVTGLRAYRTFREATLRELTPEQVWTEYILPDGGAPRERLAAIADDLALLFENTFLVRSMRPEVPEVLEALRGKGLQLAVISNVLSRRQVQLNLSAYSIDHFFNPVVTSSAMGIRKPHPGLFHEAAWVMDVLPAACAYVGDTISRDVAGARRARYGLAIQIRSPLTDDADRGDESERPDAVITNLREIIPLVTELR